jgi:hypothetical protein
MQYKFVETQNILCNNRTERIEFVEKYLTLPKNQFGGTAYWPIFVSHGGGYVEPRENKNGSVSYFYEGEIVRRERLPVCEQHSGTMEFIFWLTTKFTFYVNKVVIENSESSSHVDGTDCDFPKASNDNFGNLGFGRWNDNSTGMWDWD